MQFLTLAATKSNRLYSLDEAERFARMALAGARAQKADRMDAEIATILIELARALILKSKMFDVTVLLELEIDGIKALGDILQVPLLLDYYAAALFGCCRFRDARRECDHALVVAEQLNDGRAKAYSRAGIILLSIAIDQMSLPEFERFAEASFAEAQASGDLYIVGRMGFMIGWNYMHRGLTIEGTKWMERLMSFGREHQDPRPMGQAHLVLGWLHIMAEDYTSALSYGLDSMRSACTPQDRTVGKTVVGVSQLMLGRVAEGVETLEQQRAEADANNWHYTMFGTDTPMGVAMLLRGELKQGVKWLEDVIKRCETQHDYRVVADIARLFLAEFYLALLTGSRKPSIRTVLKNLFFIIHSKRIAAVRAEELLMHAIENPMFSERGVFTPASPSTWGCCIRR